MPSPTSVLLRSQTDERLVSLARAGHERAFEAIVERYRRPLLRAARRVLPEARAEDALQHALVAAWRGLQRGDEVRELRPWLYRIVHNTALNQLRVSGYDYVELNDSLRATSAPEEEIERRVVVRQTLTGLAALPERQREALLQIAVEGRSQDEVARELGLSNGAVRQLVHRARVTLRAAATAVTPLPLVHWIVAAGARGEPVAQRIGELTAGAGTAGVAATLAKAGAVAVLAGGAVTGPALVDHGSKERAGGGGAQAADRPREANGGAAAAASGAKQVRSPLAGLRHGAGSGDGPGTHVRRGRGGDDHGGASGRSGRRGGGSAGSGSSGSGSDDEPVEPDDDNSGTGSSSSGSGSSGSGSGSSGSGSGSSGSGSSGSGSSGSGSGSSGSVSSASGGGDEPVEPDDNSGSGSGSSGSGSGSSGSGSGSSGSGGGEAESDDSSGSGSSGSDGESVTPGDDD